MIELFIRQIHWIWRCWYESLYGFFLPLLFCFETPYPFTSSPGRLCHMCM